MAKVMWWVLLLLVLGPLNLCGYANWWWGDVRTTEPFVNYAIMTFVFLSPLLLILTAWHFLPRLPKLLFTVAILPWTIWCSLLGLYSFATTINIITVGANPSYAYLHSLERATDRIAVYRTNGGATTDWGVVIRREQYLAPGIVRVRQVAGYYHCHDAEVASIHEEFIRVSCSEPTEGFDEPQGAVVALGS